jgi:hypothetical protein
MRASSSVVPRPSREREDFSGSFCDENKIHYLIIGSFVLVDEELRGSDADEDRGVLGLDSLSKVGHIGRRRNRDLVSSSFLVRLPSGRVKELEPNERRRRRRHGGGLLLWVGCHFYLCF